MLPSISRRKFLEAGFVAGSVIYMPSVLKAAPAKGGTLVVAQFPEPTILTTAPAPSGPTNNIAPKVFDGLFTYDFDFTLKPQLATALDVSPDGLTITVRLRDGVKWHDGKPFTAADVNFTLTEIWKKLNSRGQPIYANVTATEAPDPLTAIWRLSKPAPYIRFALASHLSQIVPKHLYEGTDIARNPANLKPIGTGPFKFVEWQQGEYLTLERNPDYWDAGKPHLDKIIYRFIPDASARAAALEAGEVHLVAETGVPGIDLARFAKDPRFTIETRGYNYIGPMNFFLFNLERKPFDDVRVRRAFAHAIDRQFLIENIWFGYGKKATGPIPEGMSEFYTPKVDDYAFDPERAKALLDEAGLKPDVDGIRLSISHDYVPYGDQFLRTAEYIRDALGKIGVKVTVRTQDNATYVKRIYTSRDFDTANYLISVGPDPAIGTQRLYWSKSFAPGVAFSNGARYENPEVDALLEAAQVEIDPAKRRELYHRFQAITQVDLPQIPLVAIDQITLTSSRLKDTTTVSEGPKASFVDAYLDKA